MLSEFVLGLRTITHAHTHTNCLRQAFQSFNKQYKGMLHYLLVRSETHTHTSTCTHEHTVHTNAIFRTNVKNFNCAKDVK